MKENIFEATKMGTLHEVNGVFRLDYTWSGDIWRGLGVGPTRKGDIARRAGVCIMYLQNE